MPINPYEASYNTDSSDLPVDLVVLISKIASRGFRPFSSDDQ
ncbi:hypothetical protein OAD20_00545 [Cyclobacteriaceae bacterium]|nr:hypothetical protein [Cyclobacteriaceae bacterium]MDB4315808.1 hypothetical protein [Cyclobacteriaceae bacterium]MDB9939147.1 hypothetical protein [Cyclobacteriaceae bacterium]